MIGTDEMSASGHMDISESFRPEDLSKTDFFDFVSSPGMDIGIGMGVSLHTSSTHLNHHQQQHNHQHQHQHQHHPHQQSSQQLNDRTRGSSSSMSHGDDGGTDADGRNSANNHLNSSTSTNGSAADATLQNYEVRNNLETFD